MCIRDRLMTNHIIRYNYIHHTRNRGAITSTGGIEISGDNTLAIAGHRTGFQIYGNIMHDLGIDSTDNTWMGSGVSSNNKDPMRVFNNTMYNVVNGLRVSPTSAASGEWFNNVIVNATNKFLLVTGSGTDPTLVVDYNLYYKPGGTVSHTFSPSVTHDVHSKTNDPGFTSLAVPSDFKPTAASPVVNAGVTGGQTLDFFGATVPSGSTTDMGAAEYVAKRKGRIKP